jgi:HSP20 family protein
MQLIHQDPFALMSSLSRDAHRLLKTRDAGRRRFVPAVDIFEEPEQYVVEADLPGIDAGDIEITVDSGLLTIRGERKVPARDAETALQRAERTSGPFERLFKLPETAASEGFEAEYRLGVLRIRIPKTQQAKPYRIEVTAN